jgi:hypothetical protein
MAIRRGESSRCQQRGERSICLGFLDKSKLLRLKLRAMRAGVWFRALPQIDRALLEVTLKVKADIRNLTLVKSISAVASKLEGLIGGKLLRAVGEIGFPLAHKFGALAKKWGNVAAASWGCDEHFARFLAVMNLNERGMFKTGWGGAS